jgi:PAS domain S-box-containing protein
MGNKQVLPTNIEKVMNDHDFIVSKTNTKGHITYCNRIFMDMSGYKEDELLHKNHNIIRHPDMPRVAFKLAWDTIQANREFFGFVKNLRKNGDFYWVFAHITADYDESGNVVGYTSVRRAPKRSAVEAIEPLYKQMLQAEKHGGMDASGKILFDFLDQNNIGYGKLVLSLQKDN